MSVLDYYHAPAGDPTKVTQVRRGEILWIGVYTKMIDNNRVS